MSERNYSYKDVVMLMAAKTILQNLLANLDELKKVRSNWTEEHVNGLIGKIDLAIDSYLGLDKKQPLRDATELLKQIQVPAIRDLNFIKTQIEVDFKKDAAEILKSLGFTKNPRKFDQEGLIELLFAFKKGMTNQMKTKIIEKGTNPGLIEDIIGYAVQLEQANLQQEGQKTTTKEVSEEALTAFNDIYGEVSGIAKIAAKFYQDKPLKKAQFTFTKVVKNMGVSAKKEKEPTAE